MHSPFVYGLIRQVIMDRQHYPAYGQVEELRKKLLADHRQVEVQDLGAGSAMHRGRSRTVHSITRYSAKPRALARLLFRLARHMQPVQVIELGTSLGISTSYLALAAPGARVVTIEGNTSIAEIAKGNFDALGLDNTRLITGDFDQVLPGLLKEMNSPDFVFIDGNHKKEPTLRYVEMLRPRVGKNAVMVLDDIHWSREMEEAWEEIKKHPSTRCTIDIFWLGLVFFRDEFHEQQHFRLRF